jgi:hypothetical protein
MKWQLRRSFAFHDRTSTLFESFISQVAVGGEMWDNVFRTQTGQNINVAANGIAKLLRMMIEEDD